MELFSICRGEKETLKPFGKDFGGVLTSFTFKGNKDLLLRGLSFFGPHEKTPEIKSKFMVTIQIWVSPVGGQTPMTKPFFEENYTVEAWRGKKFSIEFQKIVFIAKHTWVDIRFQLDGPNTEYLKEIEKFNLVHEDSAHDVRIDSLIGSTQLSDLHFGIYAKK